ncbi:Molybdenum cofactor guanylyltransferase [Defluviimonas aquaemixtae]|uniref:Molybdenum cofactor guanylyltransferase n=1 Tax=Albidovulum aquaemixtae TaxID=1542388 RepID=A0A2R8B5R0_9RHOB|nr:nucleotidyltransferase family protein [Defluviimonas aquaemixtae]SPH17863.1 Molybdenum cofactor guanylyltransferase [Defluviimonas aquaemixtae]
MSELAILIPAAGASRRMQGADKLLMEIDGEPILRRTAAMAKATGAQVIVTLPNSGPMLPARRTALMGLSVRALEIGDYHDGMAASLRAGARAVGPVEGLMVLLPDMPDVTPEDLGKLIAVFAEDPTRPVRATAEDGTEGHPVIFPRRLFQEMSVLTGDRGGRVILDEENVRFCALSGRNAVIDLDTPEDWQAWRDRR